MPEEYLFIEPPRREWYQGRREEYLFIQSTQVTYSPSKIVIDEIVAIAGRIMTCGDYFMRLLARRDYSVNELLKKGREKGFEQSEIAEALDAVQQKGYQSDIRVVNSIINSSKGQYGKAALKRKCLEKGIAADVFEQVWIEQAESDSTDSLSELKAKIMRKYKLSSFQYIDPKTKAKLLNYLQYRGFNPFEILDQWKNEEEEAEEF